MIPVNADAFAAGAALTAALTELADLEVCTPCQSDPLAYFADSAAQLADAVEACRHCPVLALCRGFAEANDERFGVWGGVLRSDRALRRQSAAS